MTFTCIYCGCPADRVIPEPPPDIKVMYLCHACAWSRVEDEGDDDASA